VTTAAAAPVLPAVYVAPALINWDDDLPPLPALVATSGGDNGAFPRFPVLPAYTARDGYADDLAHDADLFEAALIDFNDAAEK